MDDNSLQQEFVDDLVHLIRWAADEPILAQRMERFLHPKPTVLAGTPEEVEKLRARVETLAERLGAPPRLSISIDGSIAETVSDAYGASALQELFTYFWRCRRSLVRAHLVFIAVGSMKDHKEYWKTPITDEDHEALMRSLSSSFWEGFETSYIRLASYWDRAGQLLDFLFFNVRHYDREGFASVMEKIQNNFVSVFPALANHDSWRRLNDYHKSEQTDGFKWLVRRRNLLVHSLHLRSLEDQPTEPLFNFMFNHLEDKLRNKLRPADAKTELARLHSQLSAISSSLPDVLTLAEFALNNGLHATIRDMPA